jgi:hypothetical protein
MNEPVLTEILNRMKIPQSSSTKLIPALST